MRLFEISGKFLDPEIYEEIPPQYISRISKTVFSKMYPDFILYTKSTPEGYSEIYTKETEDNLRVLIGCSLGDGTISINLSGGASLAQSGKFTGAITEIIRVLYASVVNKYGQPSKGILTIDYDASHGAWHHIANKLNLEYAAVDVK